MDHDAHHGNPAADARSELESKPEGATRVDPLAAMTVSADDLLGAMRSGSGDDVSRLVSGMLQDRAGEGRQAA